MIEGRQREHTVCLFIQTQVLEIDLIELDQLS
jgi:hypothetical protein